MSTKPSPNAPKPARIPPLLIAVIVFVCLILIASIGVLPESALDLRPVYKAF